MTGAKVLLEASVVVEQRLTFRCTYQPKERAMKGKVMFEVVMVIRKHAQPYPQNTCKEVEEVVFDLVPPTEEEERRFVFRGKSGRAFLHEDQFTLTLIDPDLFGTFKLGDKVDITRGLVTPENT